MGDTRQETWEPQMSKGVSLVLSGLLITVLLTGVLVIALKVIYG